MLAEYDDDDDDVIHVDDITKLYKEISVSLTKSKIEIIFKVQTN